MQMHIGWRMAAILGLVLAMGATMAAGRHASVRKQVEASMLLTGQIRIDPNGRVVSHAIDQVEMVAPAVLEMLDDAVHKWTFEPVQMGGKAVSAGSRMRLRVVARKLDGDRYEVALRSVDFPADTPPGTYATSKVMVRPLYPPSAIHAGASAMVYVAVKVGPDGRAEDAVTEQVNLQFVSNERTMDNARKLFGDAAIKAAKASTFHPPTVGEDVGKSTSVRVPYLFVLGDESKLAPPYGQWSAYVPGPYQPAPWRVGELTDSPDLLSTGAAPQPLVKGGLRLMTHIEEG